MDGKVSWLGTVHPLLTLSFVNMDSSSSCCVFNVEEEVVVIRNGWTPKKKKKKIENISSSVNVFVNLASMFTTRFVAFRLIISNSISD